MSASLTTPGAVPADSTATGPAVPVFRSAADAAQFWLECRLGPRRVSASDPLAMLAMRGRSTSALDHEATLRQVERALQGIHREWWAPVLVHLGWRVGWRRLQDGTHLRRAGLPTELPAGFSRRGLAARAEQFRRALAEVGIVDRDEIRAWDAVEQGRATGEAEPAVERPIAGWKAIAAWLGCDESTAKRYERRDGLPVHRRGGSVWAFPSELAAWLRGAGARYS